MTAAAERIKMLKQIDSPAYRNLSIAQSLSHMIKNEGFLSMFKGNFVNCLRVGPFTALEFYTYDVCRRIFGGGSNLTVTQ
jgi:hypothetical protein